MIEISPFQARVVQRIAKLRLLQVLALTLAGAGLSGCSTTTAMETYVPAHCHGSAQPFTSFRLEHRNVPGFILEVVDVAARGALERQGLTEAPRGEAEVLVRTDLEVIDRNPPPLQGDPFGETVAPSELNRFVTHLTVNVIDERSERLIWTGAVDRAHAIQGGETFHDERAVLLISQAFDDMFVGLRTPCE